MSKYIFKSDIKEEEYLNYLKTMPVFSFSQHPDWAKVKDNWDHKLCAIYENDKIVASALLLIRDLFFGYKLIYINHGPVMYFHNQELLKFFLDNLRVYAKKMKAICIIMDPFVINENYHKDQFDKDFGNKYEETINNLLENKLLYKGKTYALKDTIQPRFSAAIPTFNKEGRIDYQTFVSKVHKKSRTYMKDYSLIRGVEYISAPAYKSDIHEFYNLISSTQDRKNIILRNEAYFKKIAEAFKDRCLIYFGRIHINKYIAYLENEIKENDNNNAKEKLEEALKLKEAKGDIINVATGLVIYPEEDENIKIAESLYAGADLKALSSLRIPLKIVGEGVKDCIEKDIDYFSLGGLDGRLNDDLAEYKMKYQPNIFEFVGEFILVINKPLYYCYDKLLPLVKKIIRIFR